MKRNSYEIDFIVGDSLSPKSEYPYGKGHWVTEKVTINSNRSKSELSLIMKSFEERFNLRFMGSKDSDSYLFGDESGYQRLSDIPRSVALAILEGFKGEDDFCLDLDVDLGKEYECKMSDEIVKIQGEPHPDINKIISISKDLISKLGELPMVIGQISPRVLIKGMMECMKLIDNDFSYEVVEIDESRVFNTDCNIGCGVFSD